MPRKSSKFPRVFRKASRKFPPGLATEEPSSQFPRVIGFKPGTGSKFPRVVGTKAGSGSGFPRVRLAKVTRRNPIR